MSRLAVYALLLGLILGSGAASASGPHPGGGRFDMGGHGAPMPRTRGPYFPAQRGRPAPYYAPGNAQHSPYYAAPRPAEPARPAGGQPQGTQQQPPHNLSVGDAAQRAQQMNGGGRVLAVDPSDGGGYKVRMLKDGEVRSVYVPGNN